MPQMNEERVELSEELARHILATGASAGLELIRSIPEVQARARGNYLFLSGPADKVALIQRFLLILEKRVQKMDELGPDEMRHLFSEFTAPGHSTSGERCERTEPFEELLLTHSGRSVRPKTFHQQEYIEAIRRHEIVVAAGPAGTGKTYLACAMAVRALRDKQVSRVILSRPTIEAGDSLGFLPGDLMEKVDPHFRPLYDALQDFLGTSRFQQLLRQGVIEITPLVYMRGRTFNEAFIVLDEAQNTTVPQMKMFLTRMGYGSRVVVTGDPTQIDLPRPAESSLQTLPGVLAGIPQIAFRHLTARDVVRHDLVRHIIDAYTRFFSGEGRST